MASDLKQDLSAASLRSEGIQSALRAVAIFGVAYALSVKYAAGFSNDTPSPLWFPDSVLLCAFLVTPRRYWAWFLLVGTPIRLIHSTTVPLWFAAATYLNDGLKAACSALLLQRVIRGPVLLNTLRQFGNYMAIAAIGIPLVSAVGGALTRLALGDTFWRAFYHWFLGDATAALVLTPTLLYWWFDGRNAVKTRAGLFFPIIMVLAVALYLTFLLPEVGYSPVVLYAP